jgi:hypothetical protein
MGGRLSSGSHRLVTRGPILSPTQTIGNQRGHMDIHPYTNHDVVRLRGEERLRAGAQRARYSSWATEMAGPPALRRSACSSASAGARSPRLFRIRPHAV